VVEREAGAMAAATAAAGMAVATAVEREEAGLVEVREEEVTEEVTVAEATVGELAAVDSADGYQRTRGKQLCRYFVLLRSTLHHCRNYSGTLSAHPSSTPRRRTR